MRGHCWSAARCPAVAAAPARRCRPRPRQDTACQARPRTHYDTLGVAAGASADEIKRAFRRLALQLHPDVNREPGAADAFKQAKDAYETLSDARARAEYDVLEARRQSVASSTTRGGRSSSRSDSVVWEVVVEEGDDLDDSGGWGFYEWAANGGSWQSSWKANRGKRPRAEAATAQRAAEQAAHSSGRMARSRGTGAGVWGAEELLEALDPEVAVLVTAVFGSSLERLSSTEELFGFLEEVGELQEQGVQFDGRRARSGSGAGFAGAPSGAAAAASSEGPRRRRSKRGSVGAASGGGAAGSNGSSGSQQQRKRSGGRGQEPRVRSGGASSAAGVWTLSDLEEVEAAISLEGWDVDELLEGGVSRLGRGAGRSRTGDALGAGAWWAGGDDDDGTAAAWQLHGLEGFGEMQGDDDDGAVWVVWEEVGDEDDDGTQRRRRPGGRGSGPPQARRGRRRR